MNSGLFSSKFYSIISSSGSFVPPVAVYNDEFANSVFYANDGSEITKSVEETIVRFREITGICERRYINDDMSTSEIAFFAAHEAIESGGIDKEALDYIIVAHNFGDVRKDGKVENMPSIAAKVKHKLGIQNPATVAYDIIFGCPGWIQALIQADYFIKSGVAKKILVIGAEVCSRVCDPYDRDSMIFSDAAGAVVLESRESDSPVGILAHVSNSHTTSEVNYLTMGFTNKKDNEDESLYIKMEGRRLYGHAVNSVPAVVKESLQKAGITLREVKKVLMHQANAKMMRAILEKVSDGYWNNDQLDEIMPMTIQYLGNSSVATIPILYDFLTKGHLKNQSIGLGDHIVFASVGAGMNVNSLVYKVP